MNQYTEAKFILSSVVILVSLLLESYNMGSTSVHYITALFGASLMIYTGLQDISNAIDRQGRKP